MSTTDKIAALLEKGKTITQLQALDKFKCMRLAARIKNLRDRGMNIETIRVQLDNGKAIAKYKLTA
jgi:hypothetical protein